MSQAPVISLTDEMLAELEDLASAATPGPWKAVDYGSYDGKMQQFYVDTSFKRADIFESGGDIEPNNNDADRGAADMQFVACANPATITALTAELRRLRAENAELGRVVKDVRWRVDDTTDQLQAYSHNGDRLYGLDEWSVPIRNLKIAIGILGTAMESAQ